MEAFIERTVISPANREKSDKGMRGKFMVIDVHWCAALRGRCGALSMRENVFFACAAPRDGDDKPFLWHRNSIPNSLSFRAAPSDADALHRHSSCFYFPFALRRMMAKPVPNDHTRKPIPLIPAPFSINASYYVRRLSAASLSK